MLSTSLFRRVSWGALAILTVALLVPAANAQNGHTLTAVGPANQSMGGAGVAHPIDPIGAVHWNPATITSFSGNKLGIGIDIFRPFGEITSTTTAGAIGGVFPPINLAGTTEAKSKTYLIPSGAYVHHDPDSKWAYGIGLNVIGAFGVEYPEDPNNPVVSPQPFGFGKIKSNYSALQIIPTVAYKITDELSVGIAPNITRHSLSIEPFLIGPQRNYAGNGIPIYRPGENEDSSWGIGAQVGVYYAAKNGLELGASYKSPIAMQRLKFEGVGAPGTSVVDYFPVDYPSITSVGVGYKGAGRVGFAYDVRYINYDGVNGFEKLHSGPGRELRGLNWRSIWAQAVGGSYTVSERFIVRGGYSFGQQVAASDVALYNVASPTLVSHKVAAGVHVGLTEDTGFQFCYTHNFEGTLRGPRFGPGTPEAAGIVETKAGGNGFLFGLTHSW